jgi:hypothetical protein
MGGSRSEAAARKARSAADNAVSLAAGRLRMPGRRADVRHRWIAGVALIATLAGPGMAAAGPEDGPIAASVARLLETEAGRAIEPSAAGESAASAQPVRQQPPGYPGALNPPRKSRVLRGVLGGAVGAVGGAFAGGFLGAAIDGDCNCDDPGFKGFLIGFPVGGVVGGVLGAKYLFR